MSRVAIALVLAVLVSLACSSGGGGPGASPAATGYARTASAGGVDVKAAWLSADSLAQDDLGAYPPQDYVFLELKLDTHSGDLSSINLVGSAGLDTARGVLRPEAWVPREDGSHHRDGVLVFRRPDIAGAVTLSLKLESGAVELAWDGLPEG